MRDEVPELLRFLDEQLNFRIRLRETVFDYEVFFVDLSAWKLRFSDSCPFIWVKARDLKQLPPATIVYGLRDIVQSRSLQHRNPIVLVDGDSKEIKERASGYFPSFVIIGGEDQERICAARSPSGTMLDIICQQIPISVLSPYEISSPVTGSRFFGREYEIRKVLSNMETNYAILGIRRIGKTSLMREIHRQLKEQQEGQGEGTERVFYLDCSDFPTQDVYIREVVRKLNPRQMRRLHLQNYAFFFPNFLERMYRAYGGTITFLLDEIDNLLLLERGNWGLINMLRSSTMKGVCRYIIAGFREVMHEFTLPDSSLSSFIEPLRLEEFSEKEVADLIVTPMENLRVRFNNKAEVVSRIYQETAGQPYLIQYYCKILLEKMDRGGKRTISPDDLINVYQNEDFKERMLTTFMHNTNNLEKAVVYAMASRALGPLNRKDEFCPTSAPEVAISRPIRPTNVLQRCPF